jgi:hypothetical protein
MGPGFATARGMVDRLSRHLLACLRAADHAFGRAWFRRSVLVDVRTPMNLAVLAPVWQALDADGRLRVRFTGPARHDLVRAFADAAVTARVVSRRRATLARWDLYINADPWDPTPLWRCRRRVNFFHGVAGKYNLECPTGLPLEFGQYDRVAFPNEGRLRRYVAAGIVAANRAALVGFPKLDRLVTADVEASRAAAALGLPPDRPTAVYAPTFSPQSSLQHHGVAIVSHLLDAGFNVIVKLHDRSLDPDPRYSGGRDWRASFAPLAASGRCLLAPDADSTRYLLASDVMVTDHSTIGFEFLALDRPLVVFDVPELLAAARIDDGKVRLLRSAADVVTTPPGAARAARAALDNSHGTAAARAAAVREVFHDPGRATARAVALCYELLDCGAPVAAGRLGTVTG